MKQDIGRQVLPLAAVLFAVGGLWIAIAWRRGRLDGRAIALAYAMEIVVLAVIFVPAYLGAGWMAAAVVILAGVCTWELYAVLDRAGAMPYRVLGVCAACATILATAGLGLAGALAVAAVACLALVGRTRRRALATATGVVYPGLCLAHLLALSAGDGGFGNVVFCYGLVEVNDSIAYLAGRSIGGSKLWPEVSPNKTVAGSVVGLAGTVALAPVFRFAVPGLTAAQALAAAALLAVGGQVGDLVASRFKRKAGVKDYGSLVPAHGGVLDVYDSLIFVAPLCYYYLALCRR
ncbi:MAG TPA: phosphatidate cytidylyltransferase [Vicinamibacteria bacterium]